MVARIAVVWVVGSKTARYACGSWAKAVTVRRLAIWTWKARIAFGSGVDVKITVVGFRLGAHRFVVAQYNRI
jgi:hypothetical protein